MLWKKYNCLRFFTKYFWYSVRVNTNDINLMYITMALRCQNSVKNGFAFLQMLSLSFKYFCFPSVFIQIFFAFRQIFFIAFLQIFFCFPWNIFYCFRSNIYIFFCFRSNIFCFHAYFFLLSFKNFCFPSIFMQIFFIASLQIFFIAFL